PGVASPTPTVTGSTWIARRTDQDDTAPVRSRSTEAVVTIACTAALTTMNPVRPRSGASAAPRPVRPASANTLAREMSISVEIGGTANVPASSANGPWNPSATRPIHAPRTTSGTATTSAGVARTTVTPRANDVRIRGIGEVPGGLEANRSRNPRGRSGSRRDGARYDDAGRRRGDV